MEPLRIGEVAARTGLTERTLRYYEQLGLLSPPRAQGGQRSYDAATLGELSRIRLQRELGTPLADIDPDGVELLPLISDHLATIDDRLARMARERERVRTVEERLLGGGEPTDAELLSVLRGLPNPEPVATRRLTLLVYRDLAAAHDHLVTVFGFGSGSLSRDESGRVVHGEVFAGDGVIWLHPESPDHRLASPATLGATTHCMAVHVEDVDAHAERLHAAGADIVAEPRDMPYGVREYDVRDPEGGLWSFMAPLEQHHQPEEDHHE